MSTNLHGGDTLRTDRATTTTYRDLFSVPMKNVSGFAVLSGKVVCFYGFGTTYIEVKCVTLGNTSLRGNGALHVGTNGKVMGSFLENTANDATGMVLLEGLFNAWLGTSVAPGSRPMMLDTVLTHAGYIRPSSPAFGSGYTFAWLDNATVFGVGHGATSWQLGWRL